MNRKTIIKFSLLLSILGTSLGLQAYNPYYYQNGGAQGYYYNRETPQYPYQNNYNHPSIEHPQGELPYYDELFYFYRGPYENPYYRGGHSSNYPTPVQPFYYNRVNPSYQTASATPQMNNFTPAPQTTITQKSSVTTVSSSQKNNPPADSQTLANQKNSGNSSSKPTSIATNSKSGGSNPAQASTASKPTSTATNSKSAGSKPAQASTASKPTSTATTAKSTGSKPAQASTTSKPTSTAATSKPNQTTAASKPAQASTNSKSEETNNSQNTVANNTRPATVKRTAATVKELNKFEQSFYFYRRPRTLDSQTTAQISAKKNSSVQSSSINNKTNHVAVNSMPVRFR